VISTSRLGSDVLWLTALGACIASLGLRGVSAWAVTVPLAGAAVALAMPFRSLGDGRVAADRRRRGGGAREAAERPALSLNRTWLVVVAAGCGGFVVARAILGGSVVPVALGGLIAGAVAGVAEEAIFRHGLYGLLERWGAFLAISGSALAFALIHVPSYGWYILPINFAAGVVFGWQRWATGSWTAPAVTHALVNVVQSL
jgi:membrane protease YdiL (CAAX protease family)